MRMPLRIASLSKSLSITSAIEAKKSAARLEAQIEFKPMEIKIAVVIMVEKIIMIVIALLGLPNKCFFRKTASYKTPAIPPNKKAKSGLSIPKTTWPTLRLIIYSGRQ